MDVKQAIIENKTSLGIELGSTRIKAVLIDTNFATIAQGSQGKRTVKGISRNRYCHYSGRKTRGDGSLQQLHFRY
jgi:activator of 2-hydroxyglutaryl-CoA dehydratase